MSTPGGSAGTAKVLDLAQVSPPRLFFALLHQRFTGVAQLQQPAPSAGERAIWFSGGMPVFTDWAEQTAVLGQVLVEHQFLDEATLMNALAAMAQSGGLLGQTLLKLGVIDAAALNEGLRQQCGRKLAYIFGLRGGTVTVTPCDHSLKDMSRVNVLELILTAVGQHYDEARVTAEMGASLQGPVRATGAYTRYQAHFRFRPTDQPLLTALLKGTTLDELAGPAGTNRRRAAQLIYVLWGCQMLRVGAAAGRSPAVQEPLQLRQTPRATPSATPRATPSATPRATPSATPRATPSATPRATPSATPRTPTAESSRATAQTQRAGGQTRETPATAESTKRSTRDLTTEQDEGAFTAEVAGFEEKVEAGAHAFDLLGVSLGAGRREIRKKWSDLSRRLHPDALQSKGWGHLRDRVGNVFAALSEAHTLLSDKEQRENLAKQIERGENPASTEDASATVRAAFEADLIAREADRFLKASKFDRALAKYDEALQLNPDEPDFRAAAAWCRYRLSQQTRTDGLTADRELALVLKVSPVLARAHYFRGMVLKDLGRIDAATAAFEQALEQDGRLIDAERQLRAMRVGSTTRSKGLFSKR